MANEIDIKAVELNGQYLNICDVAEMLNISYSALLKRIKAGKIDGFENHPILIPLDYVVDQMKGLKNNQ